MARDYYLNICENCGFVGSEFYYETDTLYMGDLSNENANIEKYQRESACQACGQKAGGLLDDRAISAFYKLSGDLNALQCFALEYSPVALKFIAHSKANLFKAIKLHGVETFAYLSSKEIQDNLTTVLIYDYRALNYIENQTLEMISTAVEKHPEALVYAKQTTPEIEAKATKKVPHLVEYCKINQPNLFINLVLEHPALYLFIPQQFRTEPIQLAAAKSKAWEGYTYNWENDYFMLLEHIVSPSDKVINAALSTDIANFIHLSDSNKTVERCIHAVNANVEYINKVPKKHLVEVLNNVKNYQAARNFLEK
ncbi:MAG: hypothetical protein OCD00_03740 [Colwellia sp.]